MGKVSDMKNRQIIGYGIGSLGKDFVLGVIGSYLLFFYTDVLGITAAAAGIIMTVAKIWDAVNDPMMGVLADRSRVTKWGRYRPYILLIPVPLGIFATLSFVAPDFSMSGKIVYAAVTYIITGMLFTAYDVPLWGMVPTLTKDNNTRNKLIAAARWMSVFAIIVASVVALPVVEALGGGAEVAHYRKGFPLFMALFCGVSVIFAVITFFSTKEKYVQVQEKKEKQSLVQVFKEFFGIINKPLLMSLLAMLCYSFSIVAPSMAGAYYMIYYLGRPDLIGIHMMVALAPQLITNAIAPLVMKRVSPKRITVVCFAIMIALNAAAFALGGVSLPAVFVLFALNGMCGGFLGVTITTMVAGTADYVAEKKQRRVDGVVFSMNSFSIKLGNALGGAVVSFILAVTGYVANSFVQTPEALTGILVSRTVFPAVTSIIGLIAVLGFAIPKMSGAAQE